MSAEGTNEMSRFTAWLSEAEREALDAAAKRNHTSVNFIVRTAIRRYLKLDSPRITNSA